MAGCFQHRLVLMACGIPIKHLGFCGKEDTGVGLCTKSGPAL